MDNDTCHATVLTDECVGCGICESSCPSDAITIEIYAEVDPDLCVGCGVCEEDCPMGAIEVE